MGQGYVRQSAADILDGEPIVAEPLNREFNALRDAFDLTAGHSHDGTTGEGPQIDLTTGVSNVLPIANGGTGGIHKLNATTAPAVTDDSGDGYAVGSIWVDTTADVAYICLDATVGAAVWRTYQPLDADLTALAALATTGMLSRTAANTFTTRTITGGANISVTNGDGVAGNPTIAIIEGAGSNLDADTLDGQEGSFYQNAGNLNAGTLPDARLVGAYTNITSMTGSGTATFAQFSGAHSGNGSGLTDLNASNVASGTLADARLPSTMTEKTFEKVDEGTLGPVVSLYHNTDSQTNGDTVGRLEFDGKISAARTSIGAIEVAALGTPSIFSGTFTFKARSDSVEDVTIATLTNSNFTLYDKGDGATGATIQLRHDSASPAVSDVVGEILFDGNDSVGTGGNNNYARIAATIRDTTNTAEDGRLHLQTQKDGSMTDTVYIDGNEMRSLVPLLITTGGQELVLRSNNLTSGQAYLRYQLSDGTNVGYIGMGSVSDDRLQIARNTVGSIFIDPGSGGILSIDCGATGRTEFIGQIRGMAGSAATPSITFTNEAVFDTGFFSPGDGIIGFTNNGIETARFVADGLLVGATATFAPGSGTSTGVYATDNGQVIASIVSNTAGAWRRRSSDGALHGFYRDTTNVGTITVTTTNTAYNTSSDGRLKINRNGIEEEIDLDAVWAAIEPIAYTMLNASTLEPVDRRLMGMVAQDLYLVLPEAVFVGSGEPGDEDFMPWSIDYSKLVPVIIARQKQMERRTEERMASLEARLAAAGL